MSFQELSWTNKERGGAALLRASETTPPSQAPAGPGEILRFAQDDDKRAGIAPAFIKQTFNSALVTSESLRLRPGGRFRKDFRLCVR